MARRRGSGGHSSGGRSGSSRGRSPGDGWRWSWRYQFCLGVYLERELKEELLRLLVPHRPEPALALVDLAAGNLSRGRG